MLNKLTATVVFVNDLDTCMRFYEDKLGLEQTFTDSVSAGYRMEDQDFLLLKFEAAADMVGEEALSYEGETGPRVLLCLGVEDVDASYAALREKGVAFLKPPKDQAWGRRTAYFADPEGNLWELWHPLAG